jgi:hypothetical protein
LIGPLTQAKTWKLEIRNGDIAKNSATCPSWESFGDYPADITLTAHLDREKLNDTDVQN